YSMYLLKNSGGKKMAKMAITVNGSETKNVYPPFILGSSAVASGDDVIIFFCPGGAPAMKKGKLQELTKLHHHFRIWKNYTKVFLT
ncbi:MAG: DsrE/DsrF/DrsH-like family protein, partial [bacterium]